MDTDVTFYFRGKKYSCSAFIDCLEYPCFIFVLFTDNDLVREFGEEITIKTDGYVRLQKRDDSPGLIELRQAIFDVLKPLPEFAMVKEKFLKLKKADPAHYNYVSQLSNSYNASVNF